MLDINQEEYTLEELSSLVDVKSYVLRFWELEFSEIKSTLRDGIKYYHHDNIEIILYIKKLLFEDQLNIERAKHELSIILSGNIPPSKKKVALVSNEKLHSIKDRLNNILAEINNLEKMI